MTASFGFYLFSGFTLILGNSRFKDEFITAEDVGLKEIDFKPMESEFVPSIYFADECLDIDGITGGFNFQAAWTTGRIAGTAVVE